MTTLDAPPERITLYYSEGSSDKIYQAGIEPSDTGFIVTFAYGRRGSTLQTGTKTDAPVDYAAAKKIFDKLVQDKTKKGYTPGEDGTPYQQTQNESRATGILPQLLNPIDENAANLLLGDPNWWAQEKFDGKRVLLRKSGDIITGINRQGLSIALPEPILDQARKLGGGQWILDGEAIGDTFIAFDLLEKACVNLRTEPYCQRLKALYGMLSPGSRGAIQAAETALGSNQKRVLLLHLRKMNREGIVFKRADAPYTPGRPASGGTQVKLKFVAVASCLVTKTNGTKRSVSLELLDGTRRVGVGNVTIPANAQIPATGSILDVRYLYAFAGGSLFQPVYLGVRDDINPEACTLAQLKYKAANDGDEG